MFVSFYAGAMKDSMLIAFKKEQKKTTDRLGKDSEYSIRLCLHDFCNDRLALYFVYVRKDLAGTQQNQIHFIT